MVEINKDIVSSYSGCLESFYVICVLRKKYAQKHFKSKNMDLSKLLRRRE